MPHERSFQPRALAAPRWFTPHVDRRFVAPCSRSWGSSRFRLSVPQSQLSPPASRPPRSLSRSWNPGTSPPSPRCSYPPKNSPRCPPYRVSAALPSVPFTLPRWLRSPISRFPLPFPLRRSADDHIAAAHPAVSATSRRLRGPSGLVLYRTRSPPFAARAADDGPGLLRSFQPPNLAAETHALTGASGSTSRSSSFIESVVCRGRCQPPHTLSIPWALPLQSRTAASCRFRRSRFRGPSLSGCPGSRLEDAGTPLRTHMNLSVAAESLRSRGALVSFSSSGRPHGRPSRC